ncbi:hypothetical protein P3T73_17275 [Kiritimatiellota bacterium B12222]|nr:hypothetical protein P3T73_17275 [Kiritimatiellota bacterium B12222]
MEIEPERMDPQDRTQTIPPFKAPAKWKLVVFGILALIIGGFLLFLSFWILLFFIAVGAVVFVIQLIRSWFRGEKPLQNSQSTIKFTIGRAPPKD